MKKLLSIFKLIVSPSNAWHKILNNSSSGTLELSLYYPLIGMLSVSCFAKMLYDKTLVLKNMIIDAAISFAEYFIGYLACAFFISLILPKLQEKDKTVSDGRIKTFVMYNMSILVILDIVQNLLPAEYALLEIFPIYILFIISKAVGFFSLNKD